MSDKITKLANEIMRHKRYYYAGKPAINDTEYDKLEEKLRKLAPEHPALNFVGSDPDSKAKKIEHAVPMLSLNKTYKLDELITWQKDRELVGMLKIDGNSLSLIYKGGKLNLAKTRGNGRVGEEVTDKANWVAEISQSLKSKDTIEIRGELYCTESNFVQLSDELFELGLERPTSPRNIVAGLLGRKTHYNLARYFSFFAFEVIGDSLELSTEMDKFDWLEKNGFKLPEPRLLSKRKEIESYLNLVQQHMEQNDIGLDGAVFSYNDLSLHAELGSTAHHPRAKMSFKWQGETAESNVTDLIWATSRLGIVTPVAVIDPVFLSGATITNITLHNAAHVASYNLKIGDRIKVVRSGEVIPKFLEVTKAASGNYKLPDSCPSCATKLEFDDVRLKCPNSEKCEAQKTGGILNWIKAVEIEDLSEKRLNQMIELQLVATAVDLYRLEFDDFLKLPQTKEKLAAKLFQNIQNSKNVELARFLNGLGISGTGLTTWEKLLESFPTLKKLQNASSEQIENLDGFATKTAEQIVEGLAQRETFISEMLKVGVKPKAPNQSQQNSKLSGKSIAITGALSRPRSEIEQLIKNVGAKPTSSVSKNTFAVVAADPNGSSSKLLKAKKFSVAIWSEEDLLEKLQS